MPIGSPKIVGPISECSQSVGFQNAIRGAILLLLRTRNGVTEQVGSRQAAKSSGRIGLNSGEEFRGGDLVTLSQSVGTESSPPFGEPIEVQTSTEIIHPPEPLTGIYHCSPGFSIGGMRPGTIVEVLENPPPTDPKKVQIFGKGLAINGSAFINCMPSGLPRNKNLLIRQRLCPKPPPPGAATEWQFDSPLSKLEDIRIPPENDIVKDGSEIPPPEIIDGLYVCSRVILVSNIIPGLGVIVVYGKEGERPKSASLIPIRGTSARLVLPTSLAKEDKVEIRHTFANGCEWRAGRNSYGVDPQKKLPKPLLNDIACSTEPMLTVFGLRGEADVEIEVSFIEQGQERKEITESAATEGTNIIPAPKMEKESTVRVRQGECEQWSEWSEPRTIPPTHEAPRTPRIQGKLFDCQSSITVSLHPTSGVVKIVSNSRGPISDPIPITDETMTIPVNPVLFAGDSVHVIHSLCNESPEESDKVLGLSDLRVGVIKEPIYVGQTELTIFNVTTGSLVRLRDAADNNKILQEVYAPLDFDSDGVVDVHFSDLEPFISSQRIYATFSRCNVTRETGFHNVEYPPPYIMLAHPTEFDYRQPVVNIGVSGSNYRKDSKILWDSIPQSTYFLSDKSLSTVIDPSIRQTLKDYTVQVVNVDGKKSNVMTVKAAALFDPVPPDPNGQYPRIAVNPDLSTLNEAVRTLIVTGHSFTPNQTVTVYVNEQDRNAAPNGVSAPLIATHPATRVEPWSTDHLGQLHEYRYGVIYSMQHPRIVSIMVKDAVSDKNSNVAITQV